MISQARTLGAPMTVPAGKPANSASSRVLALGQLADDVGDDVHHMAVKFDHIAVGYGHASAFGHAANIVAAKIEQHQMFGAFLGIGEQAVCGFPNLPARFCRVDGFRR